MDPAILALIGTMVGGPVAMKILDYWLSKEERKEAKQKAMRDELRGDLEVARAGLAQCRDEMRIIEAELDKWKDRYFEELKSTWRPGEVKK